MKLTAQEIKRIIRDLTDISLKIITDLVAYQIRKGPYNISPGRNYVAAEESVAQSISENYNSLEEFRLSLVEEGEGMKGIESIAHKIYDHYYKTSPDFSSVKEQISATKDISLKAITDMVSYKISQDIYDKGPEINYLTAETFVAQYIAKNFDNIDAFKNNLKGHGDSIKGIERIANLIYRKFCNPDILSEKDDDK